MPGKILYFLMRETLILDIDLERRDSEKHILRITFRDARDYQRGYRDKSDTKSLKRNGQLLRAGCLHNVYINKARLVGKQSILSGIIMKRHPCGIISGISIIS